MRVAAFGELCLHVGTRAGEGFGSAGVDLEPGGSVHYVCAQATALGADADLYATVGADPVGDLVVAEVRARHPSATLRIRRSGSRTARVLLPGPATPELVAERGDGRVGDLTALAPDAAGADLVHLSCFPGTDELRAALLSQHARLIADFGYLPWLGTARLDRYIRDRADGAAVVMLNGSADLAGSLALGAELAARGAALVAVSCGARGCHLLTPSRSWHQPAYPVTAVSEVGAGDVFSTTLAMLLTLGESAATAADRASAAAAIFVSRTSGPATLAELGSHHEHAAAGR